MIHWSDRREWIDEAIKSWIDEIEVLPKTGAENLKKSIEYSLLRGGKRFRPILALLIGEAFGVTPKRVLPWAVAIEMLHTYSLIHDDLPCMDNDDERRGEPTNHKVFGEATALLSGDALLTESFGLISSVYSDESELVVQLIRTLSQAAGLRGMVTGQAIDLQAKERSLALDELMQMHEMKTGALIRATAEGSAWVCGLPREKRESCREFGALLGFAFQLKDDILDSSEQIEKGSLPSHWGLEKTQEHLISTSQKAFDLLQNLNLRQSPLADLVQMNLDRTN